MIRNSAHFLFLPVPGVFQFQAQEMTVEESVGLVAILIENTGNKNVAAQLRFVLVRVSVPW